MQQNRVTKRKKHNDRQSSLVLRPTYLLRMWTNWDAYV